MELVDDLGLPLRPRPAGCLVPLTASQLRLWKGDLQQGSCPSYLRTCAVSMRLMGPWRIDLLRRCIDELVRRHESLRTRFVSIDGVARQRIDVATGCHFEVLDLAARKTNETGVAAGRLAQNVVDELVDVCAGPLFATKLLKLSDHEHVLIIVVDHLVSDKLSNEIISWEFRALYSQAIQARPFSLPALPIQFGDYAVWQEQTRDVWMEKHAPYWKARMAGAQRTRFFPSDLPTDVEHPTRAMQAFPFGEALSTKLRQVSWRERTLLPVAVLAVYAVSMSRWRGQMDFILAFASHGRHGRPQLAYVVGCIATPLYLRIEVSKEDSFVGLMKRLGTELKSAYGHYDFNRVPDLVPECTLAHIFSWLSAPSLPSQVEHGHADEGDVQMQPFPLRSFSERVSTPFRFAAFFSDTADGIAANIWYRSDLFEGSAIEEFGHELRSLAEKLADQPHARIASLCAI